MRPRGCAPAATTSPPSPIHHSPSPSPPPPSPTSPQVTKTALQSIIPHLVRWACFSTTNHAHSVGKARHYAQSRRHALCHIMPMYSADIPRQTRLYFRVFSFLLFSNGSQGALGRLACCWRGDSCKSEVQHNWWSCGRKTQCAPSASHSQWYAVVCGETCLVSFCACPLLS